MKAIILKGDNELEIQKRYLEIKKINKTKGFQTISIDRETVDKLGEISSKNSLFGENTIVVTKGYVNKKIIEKYLEIEKEEEYKLPKTIYKFLDSFYPGNYVNSKKYLDILINEEPIEMIFASLVKYVRDLLWVKLGPETLYYDTWRIGKLKQYSSKYSLSELKNLVKELSSIDIKVKTSKNSLSNLLDLMILSRLE
jgi:DNA polymerase III delta subunit